MPSTALNPEQFLSVRLRYIRPLKIAGSISHYKNVGSIQERGLLNIGKLITRCSSKSDSTADIVNFFSHIKNTIFPRGLSAEIILF